MKKNLSLLFFFILTSSFSQNQFDKGGVIDSIKVKNTEKETFTLYLPNNYNKHLSPIVFIFDPSAKGKKGIKPFIKASEKYGLMLVCSNNSKNDFYDKNFEIFNNLSSHIFSNFNINKKKMYLSGFSGGSRLAFAIATITNQFSAVLACGAGTPQDSEYTPSSPNYDYVGLSGNKDFNYQEMINTKKFLDKLNFNNTLITYDGQHSWPSQKEIIRAFDWLFINEIKKNDSDFNKKEVLDLYKSDYQTIFNYIKTNKLIFAAENYERQIKSYTSFFKVDSIQTKFKKLKESKDYQNQLKSNLKAFEIETEINNKLLLQFILNLNNPNENDSFWWKKQLKKLNKYKESEDLEIVNMAYRSKFNFYTTVFTTKKFNLKDASKKQITFVDNILKLFKP